MNIRLKLLQVVKNFKANMFLFSAVESLLDEIRLIEAFSSFFHETFKHLNTLFIIDF